MSPTRLVGNPSKINKTVQDALFSSSIVKIIPLDQVAIIKESYIPSFSVLLLSFGGLFALLRRIGGFRSCWLCGLGVEVSVAKGNDGAKRHRYLSTFPASFEYKFPHNASSFFPTSSYFFSLLPFSSQQPIPLLF
jgi:hypothetical protein